MPFLILGLILFLGAHSMRMAAPSLRDGLIARLGEGPFKGLYSLVSLVGIILIVWGFARASDDPDFLYLPPIWTRHVAETLMLPALVLFVASLLPGGRIKRAVHHPLLIAALLWAVAHLFVNGDLAGVVLFGAVLIWAAADLLSQRFRPAKEIAVPSSWTYDIVAVVAGVGLYALLVWRLHFWLFGVSPMA
jgi:uncharacterized membrane protein